MSCTGGQTARLLLDPPLDGALNMARDEALLELRSIPSLRFYRWVRPTLSLGYFQTAEDLPLETVRKRGCDIVRRTTGGKAILHEHELTYSLCVPEEGFLSGGPAKTMEIIHCCLLEELSLQAKGSVNLRIGEKMRSDVPHSAWCFEDSSPLDIGLDNKKLLGSAARRRSGWVLFHGSLVLSAPQETPNIAALGTEPHIPHLVAALEKGTQYSFTQGDWLPAELALAQEIRKDKFSNPTFTYLR
ncbi:MAG: hypothetical protein QGH51_03870 [Planctomycetota bacterium]|nr:hypothetical protein [Planctomycetota bacterium]